MLAIQDNVFHLSDGKVSYAFTIKKGKPVHTYFGKVLNIGLDELCNSVLRGADSGADWQSYELSEQGRGDFRVPCVTVCGDGFSSTDLRYSKHEVLKSKPDIGMPHIRNGGETLKMTLVDDVSHLRAELYYTLVCGALVRRAEYYNDGEREITLYAAHSACFDFASDDYEIITLDGRWGNECNVNRAAMPSGIRSVSSTRGFSSHQHNPFVAAVKRDTCEECGDAYGFGLIYSGNFEFVLERDEKSQLRILGGVKLMHGGLTLAKGESFITPELVAVYSDNGIGGMSRAFHALYRKHLINPIFADKPRPVVINSWESVYFDFDEAKIKEFIIGAKNLGIDTVVLDDGWFGRRDDDTSSLGDWTVDKRKLKNGLDTIIDCCKQNGMNFGIWFEPEAVSPDSELYRTHPEYALETIGRDGVQMRNQLVLDFSQPQVVDYIFDAMKKILSAHDISYVKWDCNRPLSDVCDTKKYLGQVRGVYNLYERLCAEFPNAHIEGCASGGGRFDAGILYYSPSIWSSDDTDAYERAKIQYGLSLCYPLQALSNHVSACPNHQTGRMTPLSTRAAIATLGSFGYELNVADLSADDRVVIKEQIDDYKRNSDLILTGELFRLCSPFTDGAFCEEVATADGSAAYVVYMRVLNTPNLPLRKIRLKGLDPDAKYSIKERDGIFGGDELMYCGIDMRADGDFGSEILHIARTK